MLNARLIIDRPAPGAWNMSVDEALLIDAAENSTATLRLYGWSEPTLSLGYFQRYADRESHAPSRQCEIVRRQTGGGAILHDHELTYSLALPASHPLTKPADALYAIMHRAFIDALLAIISPNDPHTSLKIRDDADKRPIEPFLCFQRRSAGDVVFDVVPGASSAPNSRTASAPNRPWKILGSAQRRYRGAVLQHGSLLLHRSIAAPELPGICDLLGLNVTADQIAAAVGPNVEDGLGMRFLPSSFPSDMESKATLTANKKYRTELWTKRR